MNREPGGPLQISYVSGCLSFCTLVDDVSKAFDDSTIKGELLGRSLTIARGNAQWCQMSRADHRSRQHFGEGKRLLTLPVNELDSRSLYT